MDSTQLDFNFTEDVPQGWVSVSRARLEILLLNISYDSILVEASGNARAHKAYLKKGTSEKIAIAHYPWSSFNVWVHPSLLEKHDDRLRDLYKESTTHLEFPRVAAVNDYRSMMRDRMLRYRGIRTNS